LSNSGVELGDLLLIDVVQARVNELSSVDDVLTKVIHAKKFGGVGLFDSRFVKKILLQEILILLFFGGI
jgi:hypothetical protein